MELSEIKYTKPKAETQSDSTTLSREEIAVFYEKYSLTVYRVCMSFVKNETDAADLMQKTSI